MRLIYKASLVFLLKDIYSKLPITTAVILCNGKQNPYTRKRDGYYVFSNLYPGDYNISIICKGHTDLNFSVNLKENETQVMSFDMPYTVDNPNLTNLTRFEITLYNHKQLLANSDIMLKLKNNAEFLKLIEPVEPESDEIKLNVDMLNGIIGQKYVYKVKKKEHEITLFGYDQEKKCYVLKEPSNEKLEAGGKFYPLWSLKTDDIGRLMMPLMGQFMKDEVIKFECTAADDLKASVSFEINDEHQSGKVFYADAKLKQSTKKENTDEK